MADIIFKTQIWGLTLDKDRFKYAVPDQGSNAIRVQKILISVVIYTQYKLPKVNAL